jgi:hypothetical protein
MLSNSNNNLSFIQNVCIVILIFIYFAAVLTLAIFSIIISNLNNNTFCIGSYNNIVFNYTTWLQIYGWTEIGIIATINFLLYLMIFHKINCSYYLIIIIFTLGYLFQFAWYIIGSVLFFETIQPYCQNANKSLWQFSLALFIIQTILWFYGCNIVKKKRVFIK